MKQIVVNGRFLSQRKSGVQRVALELVSALDKNIGQRTGNAAEMEISLACPPNTQAPAFENIRTDIVAGVTGNAWEQFVLPRYAGRNKLINLCNIGPLSRSGDLICIHDAQIYLTPQSYSPLFRAWYNFAWPVLSRNAETITTVSNYSRDMLVKYGVAAREKIAVIHNGVDHAERIMPTYAKCLQLGFDGRPYVVTLSNTQAHKNIPMLFRAFERRELKGVPLVLIGPASANDFARMGVTPPAAAVFAGRVSDREMRGLIEHATVFAFPSTTEGFGLPPLEAMLWGTPTVVAPGGALPEVCGDGAIYASADDPHEWAQAIARLIADPSEQVRRAELGKAQAARFRWADSASQLLQLVGEMT